MRYKHNCLSWVLDRLRRHGGYFVARLSEHWNGMHTMHMTPDMKLEQYAPPEKLDKPVDALLGYEGIVIFGDRPELGKPIRRRSMVLNVWLLALGVTVWAVHSWFIDED